MEYEVSKTEEFLGGVEKVTILRQPSSKQVFGCGWLRVLFDGYPMLSRMTPGEARLFWHLSGIMNVHNRVFEVTQKVLAEQLATSQPRIAATLRNLREIGLVRGSSAALMVNPRVVYKGQTADYADVMNRWNQLEK